MHNNYTPLHLKRVIHLIMYLMHMDTYNGVQYKMYNVDLQVTSFNLCPPNPTVSRG